MSSESNLDRNLDLLVDLFPALPRSELSTRLASCENLDKLIELLLVECSDSPAQADPRPTSHISSTHAELQLIFPDVDAEHIEKVLKRNNHDFNAAAEELMTPSPHKELATLCELDQAITDQYMAKNNSDFTRALVDVLATYNRQKKAWTSRVQDRPGDATYVPLYIYNVNSQESKELAEFVSNNKELQRLNYAFLKRLLVFFQGNVYKVLEAAKLVVEAHKEGLTFHSKLELESFVMPKAKASDVLRAGPSKVPGFEFKLPLRSYTNKHTKPAAGSGGVVKRLGKQVDLHGYLVKDALEIAEEAVDLWWQSELDFRDKEGFHHRYGTKCQFVPPLDLVTGRGIHSQGGPKIRGQVIRMLGRKCFLFEEDTGRVIVIGKKVGS